MAYRLFIILLHTVSKSFTDLTDDFKQEIHKEFNEYLVNLGKEITDKIVFSFANVVANQDNPLRQKGFHPALILHLRQYLKKKIELM